MNFDLSIDLLNQQLNKIGESHLNPSEIILLQGIREKLTYSEIGQKQDYSKDYLTNVSAPKLYHKLSKLIGKNVKKKIVMHY